jgi:hypothetical protein
MMKQEDLFKKIGLILNELNDQYQFLAQNPQQLNELELELFHANANFLADHVQIIKKISNSQPAPLALPEVEEEVLNEQTNFQQEEELLSSPAVTYDNMQEEQQVETVTFVEEIAEETPTPQISYQPEPPLAEIEEEIFKIDNAPSTFEFILNDHAEHEKFDFEEKSVDELFNRPLSDEEERIIAEKKKINIEPIIEAQDTEEDDEIGPEPFLVYKKEEEVFPIVKEDLDLEVDPIPTPIAKSNEPVEDPTYKPTLNDLLAGKSAGNHSVNAVKPSISDLKQGINLNDKLLYIKDLFNGYNLAYAEAIDLANKLPNFEAADNFFKNNYAVKNNWAEKQATVDKFYELLNQRFKA